MLGTDLISWTSWLLVELVWICMLIVVMFHCHQFVPYSFHVHVTPCHFTFIPSVHHLGFTSILHSSVIHLASCLHVVLFWFDCCWCSMWETHATSVFVLVGVAWGKPHAIWELVFVHLVSVSQWLSWVCIVVSSDWFSLCGLSLESQWESPMHGEPWRCSTV